MRERPEGRHIEWEMRSETGQIQSLLVGSNKKGECCKVNRCNKCTDKEDET